MQADERLTAFVETKLVDDVAPRLTKRSGPWGLFKSARVVSYRFAIMLQVPIRPGAATRSFANHLALSGWRL